MGKIACKNIFHKKSHDRKTKPKPKNMLRHKWFDTAMSEKRSENI